MGKPKTLYISRAEDREVWERAAMVARERGISLSCLVAEALRAGLSGGRS